MEKASSVSLPSLCQEIMEHFVSLPRPNPTDMKVAFYFYLQGYVSPRCMRADEWERLVAENEFHVSGEWAARSRNHLIETGMIVAVRNGKDSEYGLDPDWQSPIVRAARRKKAANG